MSGINRKYEDRFYLDAIGRFSFSIRYDDLFNLFRLSEAEFEPSVQRSAAALRERIAVAAPVRKGILRSGIILLPGFEKTAIRGKIVKDIVFDAALNDSFVKISKGGKRYYYPSSQEYGFRLKNGRRQPGLYYMRDTSNAYYAQHEDIIVESAIDILEGL